MSTKFVRLELSEKLLPLLKHGDIILNSMTQTRGKKDIWNRPDISMSWRSHRIPCVHFCSFSFLINSRYLVIEVYFSPHQINLRGNQLWNTNHELVSDIDIQNTCFLM